MSATTALGALAAAWVGVGLLLALVMGRHGHDPFAWWLLGTLLGPLGLPLAISAERRRGERAWLVRAGRPGRGPVDVLVGLDGSGEASAALAAVLDLLGPPAGPADVGHRHPPGCLGRARPGPGAGPGRRVLLGSTATTLAAQAKVPVLVAGGTGPPAWRE